MPTRRRPFRVVTGPLTLEGERDAILALMAEGASAHWRIGVHYNNIVDNKLAEQNNLRASDFFVSCRCLANGSSFRPELCSAASTVLASSRLQRCFPASAAITSSPGSLRRCSFTGPPRPKVQHFPRWSQVRSAGGLRCRR